MGKSVVRHHFSMVFLTLLFSAAFVDARYLSGRNYLVKSRNKFLRVPLISNTMWSKMQSGKSYPAKCYVVKHVEPEHIVNILSKCEKIQDIGDFHQVRFEDS